MTCPLCPRCPHCSPASRAAVHRPAHGADGPAAWHAYSARGRRLGAWAWGLGDAIIGRVVITLDGQLLFQLDAYARLRAESGGTLHLSPGCFLSPEPFAATPEAFASLVESEQGTLFVDRDAAGARRVRVRVGGEELADDLAHALH